MHGDQRQRPAGVAIDGKSVRGGAAPRLAPVTHHIALVLTQRQIPDKGSEISELSKLPSWT